MRFFTLLALFAISTSAFASTTIEAGRYNAETHAIELDVSYGGGFVDDHEFALEMGDCLERSPVTCEATLKHLTVDPGERLTYETISFTLEELKLNDKYFSRGSIVIKNRQSSVLVTLPEIN